MCKSRGWVGKFRGWVCKSRGWVCKSRGGGCRPGSVNYLLSRVVKYRRQIDPNAGSGKK